MAFILAVKYQLTEPTDLIQSFVLNWQSCIYRVSWFYTVFI